MHGARMYSSVQRTSLSKAPLEDPYKYGLPQVDQEFIEDYPPPPLAPTGLGGAAPPRPVGAPSLPSAFFWGGGEGYSKLSTA